MAIPLFTLAMFSVDEHWGFIPKSLLLLIVLQWIILWIYYFIYMWENMCLISSCKRIVWTKVGSFIWILPNHTRYSFHQLMSWTVSPHPHSQNCQQGVLTKSLIYACLKVKQKTLLDDIVWHCFSLMNEVVCTFLYLKSIFISFPVSYMFIFFAIFLLWFDFFLQYFFMYWENWNCKFFHCLL